MSVITQAGTVSYGRPQTIVLNQNEVLTVFCSAYSSGVAFNYGEPPSSTVIGSTVCPSGANTVIGTFAVPQQFSIESSQNNIFFETRFSAGAQETPTIEIGTVTLVAYDQPLTVTNSGTTYHAVLDFQIPQSSPAPAFVLFGASGSGTSVAVRYLPPEYSDSAVSITAIGYKIPKAITADSITLNANAAGTGTGTITYTLYKNNVATALTITVAATATTGAFSGNVSFSPGDVIACICQCSGGVTAGHTRPIITIGL